MLEIVERISLGGVTLSVERDGAATVLRLRRHHSPLEQSLVLDLGDLDKVIELAQRHGWRSGTHTTPTKPKGEENPTATPASGSRWQPLRPGPQADSLQASFDTGATGARSK